jgi:hypothetical protein
VRRRSRRNSPGTRAVFWTGATLAAAFVMVYFVFAGAVVSGINNFAANCRNQSGQVKVHGLLDSQVCFVNKQRRASIELVFGWPPTRERFYSLPG